MSNDAVAERAFPRAPRRCVPTPMTAASTKKKTDDRLPRLDRSRLHEKEAWVSRQARQGDVEWANAECPSRITGSRASCAQGEHRVLNAWIA